MEIGTETGARESAASYKNILFVDYENSGTVDPRITVPRIKNAFAIAAGRRRFHDLGAMSDLQGKMQA